MLIIGSHVGFNKNTQSIKVDKIVIRKQNFKPAFIIFKSTVSILFNKSLSIDGINKVEIYKSNSKLANRYDLMIKMDLTSEGLVDFDNSWIHEKWKNDYGKFIQSKTIFDCE